MNESRRSHWTRSWKAYLIWQAAMLLVAVIAYRLFGHAFIQSGFDGQSIGVINQVFESRPDVPLTRFLAHADSLVSTLLAGALGFLLLQVVLVPLYQRRRRAVAGIHPSVDRKSSHGAELSRAKRRAFTVIVLLLPILFVVIPYGIRYAQYMDRLVRPPGLLEGTYVPVVLPELTAEQTLQIGKAQDTRNPRLQSYLRHAKTKPPGTIRIGIFGGSFSMGEEAAPEHDISTHLERLLGEAGVGAVEVLNFGVSGFGMSQTALLWEYLGRNYDLDYTVVIPFRFHVKRDNSFLKNNEAYGPLHGVYVADGEGLEYIPVAGTDPIDACRRYFSPFQPARYWRYDTRVPMVFRPLLPSPLTRRGNPFYYARDAQSATFETYRRLFWKIASESGSLILLTDEATYPELHPLQSDSIHVLTSRLDDFQAQGSSLYLAPLGHPSGLGYEIYATELAALLLGEDRPIYRTLRVTDEVHDVESVEAMPGEPDLTSVHTVDLSVSGSVVAEFRRKSRGEARRGRLPESVQWGEEGFSSLASVFRSDGPVFIPLPFPLQNANEIAVEWNQGGEEVKVPVGRVSAARPGYGQLSLDWSRLEDRTDEHSTVRIVRNKEFGILLFESRGPIKDLRVSIGGRTALTAETRELGSGPLPSFVGRALLGPLWVRSRSVLRPVVSDYLYFRGDEGHYVDVAELDPESGSLELRMTDAAGVVRQFPFMSFEVVKTAGALFDRPFRSPLEAGVPANE